MKKTLFISALFLLFLCACRTERIRLDITAPALVKEISAAVRLEATREYLPGAPNSKDILKNYYYIDEPEAFDDFCILLPQERSVCEIAVFRFSDDKGRALAEKAVDSRKKIVIAVCKAMMPSKVRAARDALVLRFENAVALIITPESNKEAEEVVRRVCRKN